MAPQPCTGAAPVPTARPDRISTSPGLSLTIPALANDDGTGLRLVGYSLPSHGSLAVNQDQSFTYTAETEFLGEDGFTYTIQDADGLTATGDIFIQVVLPDCPPVAVPDQATTTSGTAVVVPAIANNNDPDGDHLSLIGLEMPGHSVVTVEPDQQSVRYTPQEGFVGIDSFVYTVGDGRGGIVSARATIEVRASIPRR
jgi:hypothetical protein